MEKRAKFRGALLGLAVGDAMGYTVDAKTLAEAGNTEEAIKALSSLLSDPQIRELLKKFGG